MSILTRIHGAFTSGQFTFTSDAALKLTMVYTTQFGTMSSTSAFTESHHMFRSRQHLTTYNARCPARGWFNRQEWSTWGITAQEPKIKDPASTSNAYLTSN